MYFTMEYNGGPYGGSSKNYYWDRAHLVSLSLDAAKVSVLQHLEPGRAYAYPFHFRSPDSTDFNKIGCFKKDADQRWTVHPYPLPPTYIYQHQPFFGPARSSGKVRYEIKATLHSPGIGIIKKRTLQPLTACEAVLFSPRRQPKVEKNFLIVSKDSKSFKLRSSALAARTIGNGSPSWKRSCCSRPILELDVTAEYATVLEAGLDFSVKVSSTVTNKDPDVTDVPSLRVTVRKQFLRDSTEIQTPRDV